MVRASLRLWPAPDATAALHGSSLQRCTSGKRHAGRLRLRPLSFFRLRRFPGHVRFRLVVRGLHEGVLSQRAPVEFLQALREVPTHAQHIGLPALDKVTPRRQSLERNEMEGLGARLSNKGQAVFCRRPEPLPAGQMDDQISKRTCV